MSACRIWAALWVAAVLTFVGALVCPTSQAAGQQWNGRYTMVSYASQKAGTSVAAHQPEPDFSGDYVLATDCSSGRCVASVVSGPRSSNPTAPQTLRYTWDGTKWQLVYDWQWECFRGDGVPTVFSPATSWVFYQPQADGSMQGTWHTDIDDGPCRGNVIMPVAAYPAR